MKVVLQKVSQASVSVDQQVISAIDLGLMLLVGVKEGDTEKEAEYLANKVSKMRIFEDSDDKLNLSVHDVKGEILSISQFTLLANTKKGNRPSFTEAAKPAEATALYQYFNEKLRETGLSVSEGEFGAHMAVSLVNDGPVTIVLDTDYK
ncbi:D-tyrosyl-tRNA(Tyr) deacylase [Vagococcus sp. BWB3-3]|uniref:D-aminoacyl-tRNA deacylase n=1 Tax=Vagococcus allomyrinae TaxID=2794353 RepID=A0A940P8M4_9ENTE|nr:D-aminoacyl-tRNA deacylase [Vagococcus allomyrinae]MBP1039962.1 D-tyrosyl-tRNA(Tyr) deacylase [Vagococcus allomyrinae]